MLAAICAGLMGKFPGKSLLGGGDHSTPKAGEINENGLLSKKGKNKHKHKQKGYIFHQPLVP